MILGFSTKINDKETYFIEKINNSIIKTYPKCFKETVDYFEREYSLKFGFGLRELKDLKTHTIREDKNNRWKPGIFIDFFINVRKKDMFRFAPRIPVISIQKIYIKYWDKEPKIYIDDRNFPLNDTMVNLLIKNDGFYNVEDFFNYFNKDFTGKIVHWTNLKY